MSDFVERGGHQEPHLLDALCQCDCTVCVSEWRAMTAGGQRRYCVCPDCSGGDCPNWRLDREHWDMVHRQ